MFLEEDPLAMLLGKSLHFYVDIIFSCNIGLSLANILILWLREIKGMSRNTTYKIWYLETYVSDQACVFAWIGLGL
jgi:hypothetical protein